MISIINPSGRTRTDRTDRTDPDGPGRTWTDLDGRTRMDGRTGGRADGRTGGWMDGADGADRYLLKIQNRGSDLEFVLNSNCGQPLDSCALGCMHGWMEKREQCVATLATSLEGHAFCTRDRKALSLM